MEKTVKTEAEWKKQLTPEQYHVAREKGTEPAFSGKYWDLHDDGTYRCVCCGTELFSSGTKFESGSGWPSFYAPTDEKNLRQVEDPQPRHETSRSGMRQLRRTLGSRFPRRSQADGTAVLHELGIVGFREKAVAPGPR